VKDDASLVEQSRAGDREAFGELVTRYQKKIYFLVLRFTGDGDEAWDISQEVFLRAYRGVENFRGGSSFKTWLYTIANNLLKNHCRRTGRRQFVPLDDREIPVEGDAMERVLTREMAETLRSAVEELPYKQRMALLLRVYDGLSHREIGEVLDCSEGSVKVNFHHALNGLRKKIKPDAGGDLDER